jgi:hypothetical protein
MCLASQHLAAQHLVRKAVVSLFPLPKVRVMVLWYVETIEPIDLPTILTTDQVTMFTTSQIA